MKKTLVKKELVLSVILLFISVAVAPSINRSIVTASQEDEFIEVTTQACGIKEYENTTVKLTREQYQDLEQYLVEFRIKLNQTSTREEAVPIFKEAVMELDTYGLLPKGMSVEQAQELVAVSFSNHMPEIFSKRMAKILQESNKNVFCLVSGEINGSVSIYPFLNVLGFLGAVLNDISFMPKLLLFMYLAYKQDLWFPNVIKILYYFCEFLSVPFDLFESLILQCMIVSDAGPQSVRNIVGIGIYQKYEEGYQGSTGWLTSYGLFGKKAWNGTLFGDLSIFLVDLNLFQIESFALMGMMGFTGLKISSGEYNENKFYLGVASAVGISVEPPVFLQ